MIKSTTIADSLWGNRARLSYLLIAAVILLFTMLGARELWTQEHRWADIVSGMFSRQDFLHPFLGQHRYYDKPLLSYWLIALISQITGSLTTWELRIPSALSGLLAIWAIYRLGTQLKDKQLGFLSGWLLLTTFFFVFWARTSSADMLNLAGSLFAVSWYIEKRNTPSFFNYAIFFLIVALTSLCKGLVGLIVPLLAVFADLCLQKSWRTHLRLPLLLASIPALIVYMLPFWASSHFGGEAYGQNGLYLVYKENILRYFQPFDHKGPFYTYFIYLPIYIFPWTLFFIPALFDLKKRFNSLSLNSKWIALTLLLLFLFFSISGSRRSYYILPAVPFAILFTADWILGKDWRKVWSARLATFSFVAIFAIVIIMQSWYYSQFGANRFATVLKTEAGKIKPWTNWNIVMLDAESKLTFYLDLSPAHEIFGISGSREDQTPSTLLKAWPILNNKPADTIFITRKLYAPALKTYFNGYHMVEIPGQSYFPFLKNHKISTAVAFVPNQ